ncbi:MAG: sigma-70 family RNA polymerase sigma factor, partial [Gammaproteobacteria bacterium]
FKVEEARRELYEVMLECDQVINYIVEQLLQGLTTGISQTDILLPADADHKSLLDDLLREFEHKKSEVGRFEPHETRQARGEFNDSKRIGRTEETIKHSPLIRSHLARLRFLPVYLIHVADDINARFKQVDICDAEYSAKLQARCHALKRFRQAMISENTGLVAFVAHKYKANSLSFDDLMQEGMVGLIKAVDRFDPERGTCFSTYAIFWIKQAISRLVVKQDKIVSLPVALAEKSSPVLEVMRQVYSQHQRWPTVNEIKLRCDLSVHEIRNIIMYFQSTCIEEASGIDDAMSMIEKMRQYQFSQPLEDLTKIDLVRYVDKVVATLPEKHAVILAMRFGLRNQTEMTLQAIADHFHVTRERVRQIQNDALSKLKSQFGFDLMLFLEPKDT